MAQALIASRQTVLPKRLAEPGPDAQQLQQLLQALAAAPDHGELRPWRFVIVPQARRGLLADAFEAALRDRDAQATPAQCADAREKAYRAPLLMLAIARLGPAQPDMPALERMVSMGAALQNLLLLAHAMGYGAALTSGQSLQSPRLRELFRLQPGEEPVCFVSVGSITQRKPMRPRASPHEFVSEL
ncbi:nitroreductase family protein [Azohydromonas caseinilytica]|uniref:Putative NAD(P)H nitroreductase n=1 Tax=Azohydromonas caseinilytica TaxID=2728836 RepID=A0A848F7Y9_9BURK|nr:nitroreductase family protein [Azohydromonas caseinilytica]NML15684.1 nitroreductase [Azohydromonas caseinilytica]